MGCWNKTCGLTNLPIFHEEDVYIFTIEKNNIESNHCYSTHLYKPSVLPFCGKYDDYGSAEELSNIDIILENIKEKCVYTTQEGNFLDISLLSKENLMNFILGRGDGEIKTYGVLKNKFNNKAIDCVMFKKSAVDLLFDRKFVEVYVGSNLGNYGFENSYFRYKFSDIMVDFDEWFDTISKIMNDSLNPMHNFLLRRNAGDISCVLENQNNKLIYWLSFYNRNSSYSDIFNFNDFALDCLKTGEKEKLRNTTNLLLVGIFLDYFMEMTRKSWIPQGGEGSQEIGFENHLLLAKTTIEIINNHEKEFESY